MESQGKSPEESRLPDRDSRVLRTVMDSIPDYIYIKDTESRFLNANQAVADLMGAGSVRNLVGRTDFEFYPRSKAEEYFRDEQQVIQTGRPLLNKEESARGPDGRERWFLTTKLPYRENGDQILGIIGVSRDITEQKLAQDALRNSEERYRRITEALTDYIFTVYYENHRVVRTEHGAGCRQVTGYSPEDFQTRPMLWIEMVPPENRPVIQRQIEELLATHEAPAPIEHPILRKDGSVCWVAKRLVPQVDGEGNLLSYDGVMRDITQRKQAEENLRKSQEMLAKAQQMAHVGSWEWDVRTGEVTWSDEIFRILKLSPETFRPQIDAILELTHPADRHWGKDLVDRLQSGETAGEYDQRFVCPDGAERTLKSTYEGQYDRQGNLQRIIGTAHDITEQRQAEREREEHLAFLEILVRLERIFRSSESLESIMGQALEEFLSIFHADRAWLFYPCDPESPTWSVPLIRTTAKYPSPVKANEPMPILPGIRAALRDMMQSDEPIRFGPGTGREVMAHDKGFGVQSLLATALYPKVGKPWLLGLHYCREPHSWSRWELDVFKEAARRMGDALSSLISLHDLLDSENKLRSIFLAAPIGIGLVANRILKRVNQRMLEMTGYSEEELLGQSSRILYPSQEEFEWVGREKYEQISQTGTGMVETRWRRKDGTVIDVLLSSTPLDPKDWSAGVTFTALDITQRKKTEQELANAQALLLSALEQTPAGIMIADFSSQGIRFVNDMAIQITGLPREQQLQLSIEHHAAMNWENFAPDGSPIPFSDLPLIRALERGQDTKNREMIVRRADGGESWILVNGGPVRDPQGRVIAAIIVFPDITSRKAAERERERLMRELEAKNEEMESIVYVTSHDLRSPLVNIQGFSRELQESCRQLCSLFERGQFPEPLRQQVGVLLGEEIPQSLQYILSGVSKMELLLKGLLKLSRLGRLPLEIQWLDMNALLRSVSDVLQYKIQQKGAALSLEDLPPCYGDAGQINQVFTNLIDNALNYLHPLRKGIITVSGEIAGERSRYCVSDNGIGIEPSHQKKIFEIFHRLNPQESVPGEGLGLTIVRRIVERHKGSITVESIPGEGSRFYVELPAKKRNY